MEDTQITNINGQEWFNALIEDCKSIIVEAEFTSRWAIIEAYHALGKRILDENGNFEREQIYGKKIVHECAKSLGKSKRTIYYAIQFYKKYPDLTLLPEGKNTSWGKVKIKYLSEPKQEDLDEDNPRKVEELGTPSTENAESQDSSQLEVDIINSLTRQDVINVLLLGPVAFLKDMDKGKMLGYILLNGCKSLNEYTDNELTQIMESTYNKNQIIFLSCFGVDFFSEVLGDIRTQSQDDHT